MKVGLIIFKKRGSICVSEEKKERCYKAMNRKK